MGSACCCYSKESITQRKKPTPRTQSPSPPEQAPVPVIPSTECKQKQNYFHICCFVMKVGTDACKHTFTKECLKLIPLHTWISDNISTLEKEAKKNGILRNFLKRQATEEFDSNAMDFSLTAALINVYLKSVSKPLLPQSPTDDDRSWQANVSRLREAGNRLAHNYQLSLTDEIYEIEKADAHKVLTELGVSEEVIRRVRKIKPKHFPKFKEFQKSIKRYIDEFDNENGGEELVELPDFIESTMTLVVNNRSEEQLEISLENATQLLERAVREKTRVCIDDGSEEQIRPVILIGNDRSLLIIAFDFRWNGWRVFKQMPMELDGATSNPEIRSGLELQKGEENEQSPVISEDAEVHSAETETDATHTNTEVIHKPSPDGSPEDSKSNEYAGLSHSISTTNERSASTSKFVVFSSVETQTEVVNSSKLSQNRSKKRHEKIKRQLSAPLEIVEVLSVGTQTDAILEKFSSEGCSKENANNAQTVVSYNFSPGGSISASIPNVTQFLSVETQTEALKSRTLSPQRLQKRRVTSSTPTQKAKKIRKFKLPPPSGRRLIEVVAVHRGKDNDDAWYVTSRFEADPGSRANRKDLRHRLATPLNVDYFSQQVRARRRSQMRLPPNLLPQMKKIRVPWDIPAKFRDRVDL